MGGIYTRMAVPALDDWSDAATFATVPFDKIDITAYNGDVLLQYLTPDREWLPVGGQIVRRGNFRSIPGLSDVFPPGPTQARVKRAAVGVAASVDIDLYAT